MHSGQQLPFCFRRCPQRAGRAPLGARGLRPSGVSPGQGCRGAPEPDLRPPGYTTFWSRVPRWVSEGRGIRVRWDVHPGRSPSVNYSRTRIGKRTVGVGVADAWGLGVGDAGRGGAGGLGRPRAETGVGAGPESRVPWARSVGSRREVLTDDARAGTSARRHSLPTLGPSLPPDPDTTLF